MFYALAFDGICIILDYYNVYTHIVLNVDLILYSTEELIINLILFQVIPLVHTSTLFRESIHQTHRGCSSKHRRFNREALLHYITDVIDDSLAGYNEIPRTFLLGPYVQAPSLGVLGCSWWEHGLRSWGVSEIDLSTFKIPKHNMERFESVSTYLMISYESSKSSLWKWHKISKNTLQHSYGLC